MHEIGHVFNHLSPEAKSKTCLTLSDIKDNIEEQEADMFANNHLIPAKEWHYLKSIIEMSIRMLSPQN
jgi:Zn-dependent peptidase ImmA (M78 family)